MSKGNQKLTPLDGHTPASPSGRRLHHRGRLIFLTGRDFLHDSGPQWAAAIAYYALLSIFPLLLAIASIAAFFVDPQWAVEQAIDTLGNFLPAGQGEIKQIVKSSIDARRTVSILSIAGLLWSGTRVFGVITKAMNITYDSEKQYSFWKRLLIELAMFLTIGLLLIIALASQFLIRVLWDVLGLPADGQTILFQITILVIPALLLFMALFLIYRFVPRRRPETRSAVVGAILATLLLLLARPVFLYYVQQSGRYNLIYGSLAIVIILMLWAWITALILLLCGELVSHYQEMIREGKSGNELSQRHAERMPTEGQAEDSSLPGRPFER